MAIPARPFGPIFPPPPITPAAPSGSAPGAPLTAGRGSGFYDLPEGLTMGGPGYTPLPADRPRFQRPSLFNWGPYADGSWLQQQLPQGFQGLLGWLGGLPQLPPPGAGVPARPVPTPTVPSAAAPARPVPVPVPGTGFGNQEFPLLSGLVGKKLGPEPVPPPGFVNWRPM